MSSGVDRSFLALLATGHAGEAVKFSHARSVRPSSVACAVDHQRPRNIEKGNKQRQFVIMCCIRPNNTTRLYSIVMLDGNDIPNAVPVWYLCVYVRPDGGVSEGRVNLSPYTNLWRTGPTIYWTTYSQLVFDTFFIRKPGKMQARLESQGRGNLGTCSLPLRSGARANPCL